MWFEDLTECDYFSNLIKQKPLAVGWLENGKPYEQGQTPQEIIDKTYGFTKTPGMFVYFCGYHVCDFCDYVNIELGAQTILIAYKGQIYICPALVVHYMESHSYLPPAEFIEAVLNYDHGSAMEYFEKIRENKSGLR